MKFYELLNKISIDDLVEAKNSTKFFEENFMGFVHVFIQLRRLEPVEDKDGMVINVRIQTEDPPGDPAVFNETIKNSKEGDLWYGFDLFTDEEIKKTREEIRNWNPEDHAFTHVFGIKPGSEDSWSLSYTDWAEILTMKVNLQDFTPSFFALAVIEDITFHGYEYEAVKARNIEFIEEMNRRVEDYRNEKPL